MLLNRRGRDAALCWRVFRLNCLAIGRSIALFTQPHCVKQRCAALRELLNARHFLAEKFGQSAGDSM
jgi:hypothetical protein